MTPPEHQTSGADTARMSIAIVGGGRRCLSLLQMLQSDALKDLKVQIKGVADIDPGATGYQHAVKSGIFTTLDFQRLFDLPYPDLVINLTGSQNVTRQLTELVPPEISVFPHAGSRLFQEIVEKVLGATRQIDQQADEISRAQAFSRAIAEATIVGVIVLDLSYRIVWINGAALRTAGLTREEALGRYCFQVSHQRVTPCTAPEAPCPMQETLETAKAAHAIHEHHSASGHPTYCDISTYPLFNRSGEVVEVVEIIRDITAELNEKFEQRSRALKEDLAKLVQEDKLVALGKMVASVAHEINNPISSIINFTMLVSETLKEGTYDKARMEKLVRYLELSQREAERCGKIVNNLLSFARQHPLESKVIDLCDIIERVIHLLGHTMELSKIHVAWKCEKSPLYTWADYNQIEQCLLNLVFNAIESMPDGGSLTIRAGDNKAGSRVWCEVADQGTGIADRDLPHIYEPFFTTKSEGSGVGMGLSMVYGIIREHKGEITVDSKERQGTTFKISLPAALNEFSGEKGNE
ncbi:MAG: ATP-binding protein [Desulfosalsimonas sp.]